MRVRTPAVLLLFSALVLQISGLACAADAESQQRLTESIKYLASDDLEGRGLGTEGLGKAAEFIAEQFAAAGLETKLYDGTAFQSFTVSTGAELGKNNQLTFTGPAGTEGGAPQPVELKLGFDFTPMSMSGAKKFDLPIVFVGYGITGKDGMYDDYQGIDVQGKAVIILRKEPQQSNPHSSFNGAETSPHAYYARKISNAYEHGAAAIIFCTDNFEVQQRIAQRLKQLNGGIEELAAAQTRFKETADPSREQIEAHRKQVLELLERIKRAGDSLPAEYDPVLPFQGPEGEGRDIPILFCRREFVDRVLKAAANTDLTTLEKQIDEGPKPHSLELPGWRISGETDVIRTEAKVRNVVAVLEGSGPHADETIVVGAHYDHLGRGEPGSLARGSKDIHNGADDNGSGTAVLIEVARQLAERKEKLGRRVVFIAFTAEERGLLGSARYVREPLFPLEKTVAMINMDMVGRLKDDKLIVYGTGTAKEFDPLVERLCKEMGFTLTKHPEGFGPSDHSSFYAKKIPVLHYFTGLHDDYHRPSDDTERVNVEGMARVAKIVADSVIAIASDDKSPAYAEVKGSADVGRGGGDRPYFGSIPDFGQNQPGFTISGVATDGPAAKAGLLAGDVIIKLGDSKIGNLEDFDSALRKHKAGDKVPVVVRREGKELTLDVVLDAPR